jgi:type I restriction enzyme S subunit
MNSWPIKRIEELCEITSSKRVFASDYVADGVPFFRGREITEKHKGNLNVSTELFISEEKFTEIERKFGAPKSGDLLLTSVGTLGSVYVVKPGDRFYFKDGNLTWFRNFDGLDSTFLSYWLRSPAGKGELKKCTIGSSQSAFTIALLKSMEIELPPLPIQRQIAETLSAYDELIENSQRRIKILEEMARALYREWFVHFRFPGHETVARVPSPLGEIPKGWEEVPVERFGKVITGKTPSKANEDYYGIDMPFVKTPDMHGNIFILSTGECLSRAGTISQSNKTLPAGSICVSCIGTIGVVSITATECQTNQQINSVILGSETVREFLFLRLQDAKKVLENLGANGATMGNVNKSKFETLEILTPPPGLLVDFHKFAQPLFAQVLILSYQIQNLRQTRDLLLPRLLSGQIDVEALDDVA